MSDSTLTTKGQITIPKEIRDGLQLRVGQRLAFHITGDGQVMMRPANRDVRDLKGIVRSPHKKPVTIEKMNAAIAEGFARK